MTYAYDGTDPVSGATQKGLLSSKTDGNGHVTRYRYTARNEPWATLYPDGTAESVAYDENGNTTFRTKADGSVIAYTYDADNRLTDITYPHMAATHFDYDADGRKTHMHDSTGDTYWTYGDGVHLTQVTSPQGTVTYAYDSDGRRTTLTATGIGSWTTTFDPGGRVTSTKNPYNETTTFSYDVANRLIQKTKGNLNYELYAYDAADQMTSIGYWWAGSILDRSLIYSYDPAGNVQSRNEGNRLITYGYDGADQLALEWTTGAVPITIGYTYDNNGNRLSQTQNGSLYQSFTYDAHDKLTSGTGGNETDGYDANGNETSVNISGGFYTLYYDDEDRMTQITSSGGLNNTFVYNGLGMRVGKTDSSGTYSYLCDGTTPGSPVLSDGAAVYTPGQSEHRAGVSSYPDFDSLGNILTIDAGSGQVTTSSFLVTGFGTPLYTTGSSPTPFKYGGANGCQTDNDTGLILMGYRYYDTRIGRFISQDPIGDGDNWYTYSGNSPITGADPSGLLQLWPGQPDNTGDIPGFNGQPTGYWPDGSPYFVPNGGPENHANENDPSSWAYDLDSWGWPGPHGPNTVGSGGGNSALDQAAKAFSDFFMSGGLGTNMGSHALAGDMRLGPGKSTFRYDMSEPPDPDMHIYHNGKLNGPETNIDHNGKLRLGSHKGKELEEIPRKLKEAYRPIIRTFLQRAGVAAEAIEGVLDELTLEIPIVGYYDPNVFSRTSNNPYNNL